MDYGLIGASLKHSYSKEIHSEIGGYDYILKELSEDKLAEFFAEKKFKGVNVTIPYKEKVIPYLDFVSPVAERIGAVNTVVNRNGKLYGYNTDYEGLKKLVLKNVTPKGKKTLILGGGGTYKTARAVLSDSGASEIICVGRDRAKCDMLYSELKDKAADAEIIVNATPVGTYPKTEDGLINFGDFPCLNAYIDVVYNPLRTVSVNRASERGVKAEGGLYMLVYQAVLASELFTGKRETEKADVIFEKILSEKRNIVLTGMPSSGKTTVGKILAEKTGKEFVDLDDEIKKRINCGISEYFSRFGEEAFRDAESEAIKDICPRSSLVIATGGGAILRKENVERLKRNGKIYFIDRPLEQLTPTADRPTAGDAEMMKKRYEERYSVYLSTADVRVDGGGKAEDVAKTIGEDYSI